MINNSFVKIYASTTAPDPKMNTLWTDLNADPAGTTLKLSNGTSWVNPSAPAGNSVVPVVTSTFTTNGVDDGNGNITGTQDFQLPLDVNLTYFVLAVDGSLINQGFTINSTTKVAHFATAPLTGTLFFIYFKTV